MVLYSSVSHCSFLFLFCFVKDNLERRAVAPCFFFLDWRVASVSVQGSDFECLRVFVSVLACVGVRASVYPIRNIHSV